MNLTFSLEIVGGMLHLVVASTKGENYDDGRYTIRASTSKFNRRPSTRNDPNPSETQNGVPRLHANIYLRLCVTHQTTT